MGMTECNALQVLFSLSRLTFPTVSVKHHTRVTVINVFYGYTFPTGVRCVVNTSVRDREAEYVAQLSVIICCINKTRCRLIAVKVAIM